MDDAIRKQLHDISLWQAEHDGRINAWWENQRNWNSRVEVKMCRASDRLSALEKKVMWFSGFAAAVGSVAGVLVTKALGG